MRDCPRLRTIPIFDDLIARHDVSHRDAAVYGAIAAFQLGGFQPNVLQIARAIGANMSSRCRSTRRTLRKLESVGLLRAVLVEQNVVQYELLGPNFDEVEAAREKAA